MKTRAGTRPSVCAAVGLLICAFSPPAAAEGLSRSDLLVDLGVLSLSVGAIGAAVGLPVCAFSVSASSSRHACEGGVGGAAIGLAVIAVPLLVIGGTTRQSARDTYLGRLVVAASAHGMTLGWTAPRF